MPCSGQKQQWIALTNKYFLLSKNSCLKTHHWDASLHNDCVYFESTLHKPPCGRKHSLKNPRYIHPPPKIIPDTYPIYSARVWVFFAKNHSAKTFKGDTWCSFSGPYWVLGYCKNRFKCFNAQIFVQCSYSVFSVCLRRAVLAPVSLRLC